MNPLHPSMTRTSTLGSCSPIRCTTHARQRLAERGGQSYVDAAAGRARRGLRLHACALEIAQDRLYAVAEYHPGIGQRDTAAASREQLHAEVALERAHVPGQRRLGEVEPGAGLRDALDLAHLDEVLELTQVHGSVPGYSEVRSAAGRAVSGTFRSSDGLYQNRHAERREIAICRVRDRPLSCLAVLRRRSHRRVRAAWAVIAAGGARGRGLRLREFGRDRSRSDRRIANLAEQHHDPTDERA